MELRRIQLDEIAINDRFFSITYPLNLETLVSSIRKVGLLQPVLLREYSSNVTPEPFSTGEYQIVSGLKRILACRELHFEAVDAFVYNSETLTDLDGFIWNLFDNLTIRAPNLIEKTIVLHKLLYQFHLEKQVITNQYMPLLGLDPSLKVLEAHLYVHQLEEETKNYLLSQEIPMRLILELFHFSQEDRRHIFLLATSLKLNTNLLKELSNLIEEITERDEIPVENLLDDLHIRNILANSIHSVSQKIEKIRKILKQTRYPIWTNLEAQVQEKFKQLKLPKEISIILPPFFEEDRLKVTFRFRDKKELKKILDKLQELAGEEALDDILRMISDE
jgi:hypothetical protein